MRQPHDNEKRIQRIDDLSHTSREADINVLLVYCTKTQSTNTNIELINSK